MSFLLVQQFPIQGSCCWLEHLLDTSYKFPPSCTKGAPVKAISGLPNTEPSAPGACVRQQHKRPFDDKADARRATKRRSSESSCEKPAVDEQSVLTSQSPATSSTPPYLQSRSSKYLQLRSSKSLESNLGPTTVPASPPFYTPCPRHATRGQQGITSGLGATHLLSGICGVVHSLVAKGPASNTHGRLRHISACTSRNATPGCQAVDTSNWGAATACALPSHGHRFQHCCFQQQQQEEQEPAVHLQPRSQHRLVQPLQSLLPQAAHQQQQRQQSLPPWLDLQQLLPVHAAGCGGGAVVAAAEQPLALCPGTPPRAPWQAASVLTVLVRTGGVRQPPQLQLAPQPGLLPARRRDPGAATRGPRISARIPAPIPALYDAREAIIFASIALNFSFDSTALAIHIWNRIHAMVRILGLARWPAAAFGDVRQGPRAAAAERVFALAALWLAAKLEETRNDTPGVRAFCALGCTLPSCMVEAELCVLSWCEWSPYAGFLPLRGAGADGERLLGWCHDG